MVRIQYAACRDGGCAGIVRNRSGLFDARQSDQGELSSHAGYFAALSSTILTITTNVMMNTITNTMPNAM